MNKQQILVISSYPPKEKLVDEKVGGVAYYLKNFVDQIESIRFTILSEKFKTVPNAEFNDTKGNKIIPTWDKNAILSIFATLKQIKRQKYHSVVVNYDFGVFGGTKSAAIFPFFLILLRLKHNKITIIQHSALQDLTKMAGHLQMSETDFRLKIYGIGIKLNFVLFLILCNKILLLEEEFKERLLKLPFAKASKISVVQHPIYNPQPSTKLDLTPPAQIKRGKFNILFFGFLTWYKGADWIVRATIEPDWPEEVNLIMAGGKTINLDNDDYYESLLKLISKSQFTQHTGFVSDESIGRYFTNADIIVLPYRVLMASSGPLAWAIAYKKPFLISDKLLAYTKAKDMQKGMEKLGINPTDFSFTTKDFKSLVDKILELKNNPNKLAKLSELSHYLNKTRNLKFLANEFGKELLK